MKIASYCRISTDEERQPHSLEAQRDRLDAYIASQDGWKLVHSYSDQMSGKTLERPALRRALADAKDGCYDLLLVFKVDRLARSVAGLARILEGLDSSGVVPLRLGAIRYLDAGRAHDGSDARCIRRVRARDDR